jgi:hypothetical protein
MNSPGIRGQSASAIVVVLSITVTVAVIIAVAMEYTSTIRRHVQRGEALQSAIAIGDGALEGAFCHWRGICRLSTDTPLPTTAFASIPVPTQAEFPDVPGFTVTTAKVDTGLEHAATISNFNVIAVDPEFNVIEPTASPVPGMGQGPTNKTYYYLAQADVTVPVVNSRVTARVRRVLQKQEISPWNYAIFYVDPLEIQPGALMNVYGWVHTNADLYTGHNLLHFLDKVTYASDWFVGFKPGDSRAPGGSSPESPTSPSYPANLPPAYDVAQQPFGLDSTLIFSTLDSNPNNDSYHELLEQSNVAYPDPLAGKRYYNQAGVKILIDDSNTVTIKDSNGVSLNDSSPNGGGQFYTLFKNAITTNQSIQDNREGQSIRLTTLDVGAINDKIRDGTLAGFNKIIYITDTSAGANGGTPKRAIRLKNGANMANGGLTVASANPVYIQGNYNTGGSNPPSNSGDPTTPQVTGYTRQPCAVIADAVNVLSSAWLDSHSSWDVSARDAVNTTVNTAVVAGIVPSANNNYSGGAENFLRFLEDWGGKTFTYYGSMVELYKSRQSIGKWGSDNVYGAPARQWFFDTNFQYSAPPGSLLVYSYIKGRWFLAK